MASKVCFNGEVRMTFTMDTINQFPNGTLEITVGVAQHGGESYLYLKSKKRGGKTRFIDMNRSEALQLARAIEVVAESLP